MKKTLFRVLSIALATVIGFSASSCSDDDPTPVPVEMAISVGEITKTTIAVTITPSENAAKYSYAIGLQSDLNAFTNGTLTSIVNATGNQPTTVTFSGLDEETEYVIFARGEDANQILGEVTTKTATTLVPTTPAVKIEFGEITAITAEITTTPNSLVSDYYGLIVSKAMYEMFVDLFADGDKIAFMQMMAMFGEATILSTTETLTWLTNGSPDYEYIFAVLINDKDGNPYGEVMEIEFQSPPFITGLQTPQITYTLSEITSSTVRVNITPDEHTFGYHAKIFTKAEYDDIIATFGIEEIRIRTASMGYTFFEAKNSVWSKLDDMHDDVLGAATDYVMSVSPFNKNGIDGYGELVIKDFTTLAGSPATNVAKHKAVKPEESKKITRKALLGIK